MTDHAPEVTPDLVRALCGELSDASVAAIISAGPTVADLEAAVFGDDERMVAPASGTVAAIQRVLAEEAGWNDDGPRSPAA